MGLKINVIIGFDRPLFEIELGLATHYLGCNLNGERKRGGREEEDEVLGHFTVLRNQFGRGALRAFACAPP